MKKGKKYINKDGINKVVDPEELDKWLKEGWKLGNTNASHPGYPAWNKGLTKETSESIAKMAESKRGIPRKEETRYKLSIANKGKKHSKDTLIKMSNSHKGINFTEERCRNISKSKMGHKVSEETRKKLHDAFIGTTRSQSVKDKISKSCKGKIVSKETRERISEAHKSVEVKQKIYNTKRKNNTFNSSKHEELYYKYLLETYSKEDIVRQYKDSRYPFLCDFYIKSEDLFIELNLHWTHGKHPFDKNNEADVKLSNQWKELGDKSKYYKIAYYVWTELDVKKQQIAKDNKLNYKAIYNL